jgi:crossover junction endodeoxyribonuclease RusA
MTPIQFFIPGIPAPGGSKRAFVINGRAHITDDCKRNKPWRESIAVFARQAYQGDPLTGPLSLVVEFVMPRPKGHYGSGRNASVLKPSAPMFPAVKPDCTKLLRALEDALTGILWRDDATIVKQYVCKSYGEQPGASVFVAVASSPAPDAAGRE